MPRTSKMRTQSISRYRHVAYRPLLELLESRLPPGDALLGAMLAQWMLAPSPYLSERDLIGEGGKLDLAVVDTGQLAKHVLADRPINDQAAYASEKRDAIVEISVSHNQVSPKPPRSIGEEPAWDGQAWELFASLDAIGLPNSGRQPHLQASNDDRPIGRNVPADANVAVPFREELASTGAYATRNAGIQIHRTVATFDEPLSALLASTDLDPGSSRSYAPGTPLPTDAPPPAGCDEIVNDKMDGDPKDPCKCIPDPETGVKCEDPVGEEDPLRPSDGTPAFTMTDLKSSGFGVPWGQTRSWTNSFSPNSFNGSGMVISQLPYLVQVDGSTNNSIVQISTGFAARYFDLVSGTYVPHHYLLDKLVYNAAGAEFVLTDPHADQIRFYDFSSALVNQRGRFKSLTDPAGNVTLVTSLTTDGKTAEVQRSNTTGGTTVTESYLYSYLPTGDANVGLLSSVTLRRKVNAGNWVTVRQVAYDYYDGTAQKPYGNLGDLRTATIMDGATPTPNVLDVNLYRYFTPADAGTIGYVHGLKYVFGPQSYARLAATVANPLTATDSQAAAFGDFYFEFDGQQRVTKEILQGAGSSATNGGRGTLTFTYTTSAFASAYNNWKYKQVETLNDGNQVIQYANFASEPMLTVFHDQTTGNNWEWFKKYDSAGRAILRANPSALTGYDETKADLLNNVGGTYQYMLANQGKVEVVDFYTSTTPGISDTTAGGVAGYYQDWKLQQGQSGTPILQDSRQYFSHTAGPTIYPVASTTSYRNADGTGAETTSYSYTWFPNTVQQQSMLKTLPVISSAQNGPGTADVYQTYYDTYNRAIWNRNTINANADGYIGYTQYDQATGAVTKKINDVDTTRSGDFQNLPTGWSTPAGAGLHLVTQMTVDALGRETSKTLPAGNVTYTVYLDPDHSKRVYPGWTGTTTTGPIQVQREDRRYSPSYVETLTMSATPHVTNGLPDGTEAIANLQTLSRKFTSAGGQKIESDQYFNVTGVTYSTSPYLGTSGTNFYASLTGYDARGRLFRSQSPTGTITITDYDGLNRVIDTKLGTSDANVVMVSQNVCDQATAGGPGGVGDGNLTQSTQLPGGSAAGRVTQGFYDWRNRVVATKSGVQASENDGTHRPITYTDYDNLNQVIATESYDGDGVTITVTNGVPVRPTESLRRARSAKAYDDEGRVYQSSIYDVNQSTGVLYPTDASPSSLTTNTWHDHRNKVLKRSSPGGVVRKNVYDGANRTTVSYTTDGLGDTGWSSASTVTGNNALNQTETLYDKNSNAVLTTVRDRFHDETTTGALGNPTTSPKARVSYSATYFDLADRLTDAVDVGTNAGIAYTRPASVPAPSDTVLVTHTDYNAAGWVLDTVDPRGLVTQKSYDNLQRVTQSVEAYDGGSPTSSTNKTTQFSYDGANHTILLTALLPGGAFEKTQYVYGVTNSVPGTNDLNSNDLLATIMYPDPVTGQPSTSAANQESFTYNALAEEKTKKDRNGSVHGLTYDVLARKTVDAVTTLASGLDGQVLRIETAYDTGGRPFLYTSYNAASGGSIVNQVQQVYNGLGQLITEYQAHSGGVNTTTTPNVQYAYSEMAGGANHSRLLSMTSPNGRVFNYNYNSGVDDATSRLSSISGFITLSSPSRGPRPLAPQPIILEAYSYLGVATVVKRAHPQGSIDLTYIMQPGETPTDAGDQYTGLDRFGRIIDQRWLRTTDSTHTDRWQYGYDRDSNRLYRQNLVNGSFSELYHVNGTPANPYDQLNQLTAFARGVLSSSTGTVPDTITSPTRSQSWTLDVMGNWSSIISDGTTQTRQHDRLNRITSISNATAPGYDNNGNTAPDNTGKGYVYDAWNRLVTAKTSPNGSNLVSYTFDGLNRRITETASITTDLYYSASWQVLEEREGTLVRKLQLWSPVYVDGLILRYRDTTGSGTFNEMLFVQQDANFNVTALTSTGSVVERYVYDPYGPPAVLDGTWLPRGGSNYAWVFLHQGGRFDNNSGLYQFRNRELSPTLGRWMQQDPMSYKAGDTNLYRYVKSRPTTRTDPSGLCAKSCGVETFTVEWSPYLTAPPFISLIKLDVIIRFKNDAQHDPAKCEYEQWTKGEWKWWTSFDEIRFDESEEEWSYDNYSRDDDIDGNERSDPDFHTTDGPGFDLDPEVPPGQGDHFSMVFTAIQLVIDIDTGQLVAQRGPHTAKVWGYFPDPVDFEGVPYFDG